MRGGSTSSVLLTVTILGGALAVAFEAYGTLTAMPAAARDLGQLSLYAWSFTAFILPQVLAIVLAGRFTDTIGPVYPLMAGFLLFTLGLLGAGLAPTMLILLCARAIQGFGGGALNLALMVVVAQAYTPSHRAHMMSALSFCWVLPSFIGPPIAAWVAENISWHWVFLGLVPVMVVLGFIGYRPMMDLRADKVKAHESKPVPIWAAILGAGGVAMIQLAGQRLDSIAFIIAIVGVLILLCGLPFLMPPGFLIFRRGLPAVPMTRLAAAGTFFALESFLPLILADIYGFSLLACGLFVGLGAVGWTIGSLIQSSRYLRIRRDTIIHLGAVVDIAALILMGLSAWYQWPWVWMAIGFTLLGAAMGLMIASTSLAIMQISPERYLGRNMSSLQVAEGLGNSIITGLSGAFFASLHLHHSASVVYSPIFILALFCACMTLIVSLRIGAIRNESSGIG